LPKRIPIPSQTFWSEFTFAYSASNSVQEQIFMYIAPMVEGRIRGAGKCLEPFARLLALYELTAT